LLPVSSYATKNDADATARRSARLCLLLAYREHPKRYDNIRIDYDKRGPNAMYLSRLILNEFPFGHIMTTVYGPKRVGKTIYIMLSQMDMYSIIWPDNQYGYGIDWRFNKAMENTVYTIQEMIKRTETLQRKYDRFDGGDTPKQYVKKAIENGIPEICVQIDDAGVGFNKYIYFTDRQIVEELKNYMDTVGIVIAGLSLSTPSLAGVLGFIREYEGYRIHILKRNNGFDRWAKIYKIVQLPGGQIKPRRPRQDPFNCWLPPDLFKKYKQKRGFYLKDNIKRLKDIQKKNQDKNIKDADLDTIIKETEETLGEFKEENVI